MRRKNLFIYAVILLIAGCAGGQPQMRTQYFMLDYKPPILKDMVRLDESLKVERFSVAQLFSSNSMIFRNGPFGLDKFPNDRWAANPGNMVADYLARDFRQAGLFRGIFSYRDTEVVRFTIEGNITEFAMDQQEGLKALLTIYVTLLDLNQTDSTKKIIFQKSYSHAAPCKQNTADGLALGLSESMERLSGQIIGDVYNAVKSRQ